MQSYLWNFRKNSEVFYNYISTYTNGERIINTWKHHTEAPATTPLSDAISKDLKKKRIQIFGINSNLFSFAGNRGCR